MNTQSGYLTYDDYEDGEGLGLMSIRMPSFQDDRFDRNSDIRRLTSTRRTTPTPKLHPIARKRIDEIRKRVKPPVKFIRPKPSVPKPCSYYKGRPNYSKPPQCRTSEKVVSPKRTTTSKKISSSVTKQATRVSAAGSFLAGSFSVGGIEIEKKHAAIAGSSIAGGLLLWKLLF